MPGGMALFRSDFMELFTAKPKNTNRNGPFSIGFHEIFYGKNPRMATGMALFRSVLMKFFTVRIQEWQPIWPFFYRFWWNVLRWKSKMAAGMAFFRSVVMKFFDGENLKRQPEWDFADWIWCKKFGEIQKWITNKKVCRVFDFEKKKKMWKKPKKYRGSATDLPANLWPKKWGKTQKLRD